MQILTTLWHTLKTILWFTWRHAFVFSAMGLIFHLIVDGWILNLIGIAKLFFITAFLDWMKMKFKIRSHGSFHSSSDAPQSLHVQNYGNSDVVGSPSYLSSIGSSSYPR